MCNKSERNGDGEQITLIWMWGGSLSKALILWLQELDLEEPRGMDAPCLATKDSLGHKYSSLPLGEDKLRPKILHLTPQRSSLSSKEVHTWQHMQVGCCVPRFLLFNIKSIIVGLGSEIRERNKNPASKGSKKFKWKILSNQWSLCMKVYV